MAGVTCWGTSRTDLAMQRLVVAVGCAVVSVEYRFAPEHPFPAPLEDCYAALTWAIAQAAALGIDPRRVAVGGASAGGGLAAGWRCWRATAAKSPSPSSSSFPMLDDRTVVPRPRGQRSPGLESGGEPQRLARLPRRRAGGVRASPYAAAARGKDLRHLPPAYISVGTRDLFVDEDIAFAQRLIAADVPVELHVYPGAFHGAEVLVPAAALSRRMIARSG